MLYLTVRLKMAAKLTFRRREEGRRSMGQKPMLSLSNTRDNYVRSALTTHKCPVCKLPLSEDPVIQCRCGFHVKPEELLRHSAGERDRAQKRIVEE